MNVRSSVQSRVAHVSGVVRLWDVYFSIPQGLDFHLFVCLAILYCTKDILEDLEQSEIRALLLRLPYLDIDQIIAEASRFQYEALERPQEFVIRC